MSIDFVYNTDFELSNKEHVSDWVLRFVNSKGYKLGSLVYAFFNDEDLKDLNIRFLNHNYYTDVISFNDSDEHSLKGNIAISIDRVKENAKEFSSSFDDELRRVMIHGLLHFMGYNDQTEEEIKVIRAKEEKMLRLFHVKQ
jgi:probable rRNA maturation factor